MIELLVALAVIGVLLGVGFTRFGSNGARLYANDIKAVVQQARFEAVKRNTPIAVIWDAADDEFKTVLGASGTPCQPGTVLTSASHAEYAGVTVASGFASGQGIVWLPSGQARSCSLGAFSPGIAEVTDRGREYTVTVTLTGRVTIE